MLIRKCGVLVALICASALVVPAVASAKSTPTQVPVTSFVALPLHGKASNGKAFNGQFTVNHFVTQNGNSEAVGHLTGFVGQHYIDRTGIAIPISVNHAAATTAAACPILNLNLGPLNLNLLGLHVHLNRVILNITAVSGPGNLLGNLLCDVANLLNGSGLVPSQVTGLLGILQQTLNVPTLLSL